MLVAVTVVAGVAPVAQADDNSVYQAWGSQDAEIERWGEKIRATERSRLSRRKKAARVIRLLDELRETVAEVTTAVKAEQPSSEKGTEAKSLALKTNARFDGGIVNTRKALRLFLDGASAGKVDRYLRRGDALFDEAVAYEKRARRAFKEAGVQVE